jgi:hypothetical protein
MGLIVEVYRGARGHDCTNHGISSRYDELCLMNVDGPFEPNELNVAPAWLDSHYPGCARIIPAIKKNGVWVPYPESPMYGGNVACTSDSRFSEAVEKLLGHNWYGAVKIHDRFETEQEL